MIFTLISFISLSCVSDNEHELWKKPSDYGMMYVPQSIFVSRSVSFFDKFIDFFL